MMMDMETTSSEALTVKEAAETMRIGRTMMYQLLKTGKVKHLKIGRKIIIPRKYLREYIENEVEKCYNSTQMVGTLPCYEKGV